MTSPMKVLRSLLFLPDGDPDQQERDIKAVASELKQGREEVRAARALIEKSSDIRKLMEETIGKLE